MLLKSILWNLDFAPRQSGKTTKLFNLAQQYARENKKVAFICANESITNQIKEKCKEVSTSKTIVNFAVLNAKNLSNTQLSSYDIFLLDDFDYYSSDVQTFLMTFFEELGKTKQILHIQGLSTAKKIIKPQLFRDLLPTPPDNCID